MEKPAPTVTDLRRKGLATPGKDVSATGNVAKRAPHDSDARVWGTVAFKPRHYIRDIWGVLHRAQLTECLCCGE